MQGVKEYEEHGVTLAAMMDSRLSPVRRYISVPASHDVADRRQIALSFSSSP